MSLNIAIDGPVGAGKSSISDAVAARLGILHQLSNQGYPVLVTTVEAMSLYTMPRSVLVASAIPWPWAAAMTWMI